MTEAIEETTPVPISIDDITTDAPFVVPISIDDLLNSAEVLLQKEKEDKLALEDLSNMTYETLKLKLLTWATNGFSNAYEITRISISPPSVCSDGVHRTLAEYIVFCSGKSIQEHVDIIGSKVTGMSISFANMGTYIAIVVSKK